MHDVLLHFPWLCFYQPRSGMVMQRCRSKKPLMVFFTNVASVFGNFKYFQLIFMSSIIFYYIISINSIDFQLFPLNFSLLSIIFFLKRKKLLLLFGHCRHCVWWFPIMINSKYWIEWSLGSAKRLKGERGKTCFCFEKENKNNFFFQNFEK